MNAEVKVLEVDDDDLLKIPGIIRASYDEFYHQNDGLIPLWKQRKVQVYTLEHSEYGCLISSLDDRILWFKYRLNGSGAKIPAKTISFEELLEECDQRDSVVLVFNLDIFVPAETKR